MDNPKIFFSWQNDIKENKDKLSKEIENAAKSLGLIYDEATRNEAGSPNIVQTVLQKIRECKIFIADVSIIKTIDNKSYPNSNVMFELGYAIATHEWNSILCICDNKTKINNLPFDINHQRISPLNLQKNEYGDKIYDYIKLCLDSCENRDNELFALRFAMIQQKSKLDIVVNTSNNATIFNKCCKRIAYDNELWLKWYKIFHDTDKTIFINETEDNQISIKLINNLNRYTGYMYCILIGNNNKLYNGHLNINTTFADEKYYVNASIEYDEDLLENIEINKHFIIPLSKCNNHREILEFILDIRNITIDYLNDIQFYSVKIKPTYKVDTIKYLGSNHELLTNDFNKYFNFINTHNELPDYLTNFEIENLVNKEINYFYTKLINDCNSTDINIIINFLEKYKDMIYTFCDIFEIFKKIQNEHAKNKYIDDFVLKNKIPNYTYLFSKYDEDYFLLLKKLKNNNMINSNIINYIKSSLSDARSYKYFYILDIEYNITESNNIETLLEDYYNDETKEDMKIYIKNIIYKTSIDYIYNYIDSLYNRPTENIKQNIINILNLGITICPSKLESNIRKIYQQLNKN
jgi:hypothetical protein